MKLLPVLTVIASLSLALNGCAESKQQVNAQPHEKPATKSKPAQSPSYTEISKQYAVAAKTIIDATMAKNDAWRKMEELCDGIGHRLSGSNDLGRALVWAVETMNMDGQENVHIESVMVPHWARGIESATMVDPREVKLSMLGLGLSVGTPKDGITAPVVVITNEDDLEKVKDHIAGKIVLFNNPMPPYDMDAGSHYGTAVRFRGKGPSLVAKHGAVACLIRSVTARSLRTPHTGMTRYEEGVKKIPAAAISVEDAEMIARLTNAGKVVRVTLKMNAHQHEDVVSGNVIGELRGTTWPEQVVVIGGHIDSWDVGQGAHDDGGGCIAAMEAINVLRKLGMKPKRTIRVVLWTNEENGLAGAKQYVHDHEKELSSHVAAIETDSGTFAPQGFGVECEDTAKQAVAAKQLADILRTLEPLGMKKAEEGFSGADVGPMKSAGVPLLGLMVEGSKYFDYHHTQADTLDKIDPKDLSQCVAAMAATAYILADMPMRLGDEAPTTAKP